MDVAAEESNTDASWVREDGEFVEDGEADGDAEPGVRVGRGAADEPALSCLIAMFLCCSAADT